MASGSQIGAGLGAAAGFYFGGPQGAGMGAQAGSAFGGMFDEPGGEHPTGKPLAIYDQMFQNYQWQKEFAQNGIAWRVQDAKNAGLHPLFALGGGGAAFAPSGIAVEPDSGSFSGTDHGQNLASALARVETPDQREMRRIGLLEVQSRISENDARAGYYRAMETKAYQDMLSQPGLPGPNTLLGSPGNSVEGVTIPSFAQHAPGNTDAIRLKPNEVVSTDTGQTWRASGLKPGWERMDLGVLGKWFVPRTDDFFETWGELSWYDKLALIAASMVQERQTRMPRPQIPNNPWEVFDLGDDFYSRGEYVSPRQLKPQLSNQKFFYGR